MTVDYIDQLETRLHRLLEGAYALSQVSGTDQKTRDGMQKAIRTVEDQITVEREKIRKFREAMWLAAQS